MLLTRKGLWKCIIFTAIYFILGSIAMAAGILSLLILFDPNLLFLGLFCYLCCPLVYFYIRYREGKAKLIRKGYDLIHRKLKPAEFIRYYQDLRYNCDLVIDRADMEVLNVLVLAYDLLDRREEALATADEAIAVAPEKKKKAAKLLKVSLLFCYGMTEEAEAQFSVLREGKLDLVCTGIVDMIMKSDRAIAMGDYKTAECYYQNQLSNAFPKPTNAVKHVDHYWLGVVYEKMQEPEKAVPHYRYCLEHGGETAIKVAAATALDRLRQ